MPTYLKGGTITVLLRGQNGKNLQASAKRVLQRRAIQRNLVTEYATLAVQKAKCVSAMVDIALEEISRMNHTKSFTTLMMRATSLVCNSTFLASWLDKTEDEYSEVTKRSCAKATWLDTVVIPKTASLVDRWGGYNYYVHSYDFLNVGKKFPPGVRPSVNMGCDENAKLLNENYFKFNSYEVLVKYWAAVIDPGTQALVDDAFLSIKEFLPVTKNWRDYDLPFITPLYMIKHMNLRTAIEIENLFIDDTSLTVD